MTKVYVRIFRHKKPIEAPGTNHEAKKTSQTQNNKITCQIDSVRESELVGLVDSIAPRSIQKGLSHVELKIKHTQASYKTFAYPLLCCFSARNPKCY